MIKLITCDLDGTLFDKIKNISAENIETIASLKETKFVVASGRPIEGVIPVIKTLGLEKKEQYTACYNGGVIIENDTKKVIFKKTITGEMIKRIFHDGLKHGSNFHAFRADGSLITNEKNPYTQVEENINKIEASVVDIDSISDNEEFIKCMLVSNEENLDRIMPIIDSSITSELTMVRSSKIFLEFLNRDANKGKALEFLANHLNIKMEETMAIGDADNDKSMLIAAGVGVAMKNSFDCLFEVADYITADNEHSGVAKAIKHFDTK